MTTIASTTATEREPEEVTESLALVTAIVEKAAALVEAWDVDALVGATSRPTFGEASALAELRAVVTGNPGDYIETIALYAAQDPDALETYGSELRDIVDEHRELWAWIAANLDGLTGSNDKALTPLSVHDIEATG